MGGLIVRDQDDAMVRVVTGIRAVWSSDQRQQHDQGRGNVRASLAESMEHRTTTVTTGLDRVKRLMRGRCQAGSFGPGAEAGPKGPALRCCQRCNA